MGLDVPLPLMNVLQIAVVKQRAAAQEERGMLFHLHHWVRACRNQEDQDCLASFVTVARGAAVPVDDERAPDAAFPSDAVHECSPFHRPSYYELAEVPAPLPHGGVSQIRMPFSTGMLQRAQHYWGLQIWGVLHARYTQKNI